jgi:hypothetical protein
MVARGGAPSKTKAKTGKASQASKKSRYIGQTKTPDGKGICFNFNKVEGCPNSKCNYMHVCGGCFTPKISMATCKSCRNGR